MQIKKQTDISLKEFNTFGIDVDARYFIQLRHQDELKSIFKSISHGDAHLILGGGSNILLTENFEGTVIRNEIKGVSIIEETDSHVMVEAGAGENWHDLVRFCVDNNYGGIENLSLIPGTCGAAPMQNIGAYGVEIKDVFISLKAFRKSTGEIEVISGSECEFGYRTSIFKTVVKDDYVILSIILKLSKKHKVNTSYGAIQEVLESKGVSNPGISDVSQAVIEIRQSKLPDPKEIGNAGSFFKNPIIPFDQFEELKSNYPQIPSYLSGKNMIKVPAGWLIETAGWKGKKIGNTGSHKNQALVLVNYGEASGSEIRDLSIQIQQDIKSKFGISLMAEVNII